MRRRLLLLLCGFCCAAAAVASGCTREAVPTQRRTLYFRGDPVAVIDEKIDSTRNITRIVSFGRERITLRATLDDAGRAVAAHYSRPGWREIDLASLNVNNAVLIDLLQHVTPPAPIDVSLVDLSCAEVRAGRVERRNAEVLALDVHGNVIARADVEGRRVGPGAFFEGSDPPLSREALDVNVAAPGRSVRGFRLLGVDDVIPAMDLAGPGQRAHGSTILFDPGLAHFDAPLDHERGASPFIESDDPRVIAFAKRHASGEALVDAARLVEAIHPLVDPRKRDVPPSAITMLTHGGDCDGAAALLTASLRALGHAARPVVGYRHVEEKLIPHAWVEVHTAEGWFLVDAAAPRVGSAPSHLKLFYGLGGALTMGRVLARLRVEPLVVE